MKVEEPPDPPSHPHALAAMSSATAAATATIAAAAAAAASSPPPRPRPPGAASRSAEPHRAPLHRRDGRVHPQVGRRRRVPRAPRVGARPPLRQVPGPWERLHHGATPY